MSFSSISLIKPIKYFDNKGLISCWVYFNILEKDSKGNNYKESGHAYSVIGYKQKKDVTENIFENGLPTLGVDVKYKYITYENKKIRLDIWDTAGQERFRGIAQNYFRGAHGIIFVFDISNKDSFSKLRFWMTDAISNMSKGTVMVIAENKIDLEEKRQVSKELIKEFGEKNNIEIFSTSAKTGEGVEQIFINLVSKLFNNKNIGKVDDDDEDSQRRDSVTLNQKKGGKKNKCNC